MTITYTWGVTSLKVTQVGEHPNYVVQTYWKKTGTDENGNEGVFNGATPFQPDPEQADFVPFDQLTEEEVISWVQGVVVDSYEEHVNEQIAKQIADKIDPVVEKPLPWNPESTTPGAP